MNAPKRFPDWLREQVKREVAEATKPPPPTKPKPAPKPPTAKPSPPKRPGVTITAYPDTAGPIEVARRQLQGPVQGRRYDTDAHDTPEPSPCHTCGGPVKRRAATYVGPWRQHQSCEPVGGSDAARVQAAARRLGVGDLSWTDAVLVASVYPVVCFADHATGVEPTYTDQRLRDRLPWRHVDVKRFRAAVGSLPSLRVAAGVAPSTCTDGRCAWCGVVESAGWFTHGHTWPDGSPAPLCSACSRVFVKHGEPTHPDDVRRGLAEAVTGVPPMMGTIPPVGLVPYAESADQSPELDFGDVDANRLASGHEVEGDNRVSPGHAAARAGDGTRVPSGARVPEGTRVPSGHTEPGYQSYPGISGTEPPDTRVSGEPWSHLNPDAVRSYRFETWARFGLAYCPPEHRAEVQAWAAERDRVRAERRRAEEAEAAERANVHGF